jgi:tellurium resistance protein TerD
MPTYYLCQCDKCGKSIKVPKNICQDSNIGIKTTSPVFCSCGTASNIIKPPSVTSDYHFNEPTHYNEPAQPSEPEQIKCPKCRSHQITANSKGFGLGKAVAGGLLAGPVGLLGGVIGSKTVVITCLSCGHKWEPGK